MRFKDVLAATSRRDELAIRAIDAPHRFADDGLDEFTVFMHETYDRLASLPSYVRLVDVPCFGRPVRLVWRKRTWRCAESTCPARSFTEQRQSLAGPRALLTVRACWWAIGQLLREGASVSGLARQLSILSAASACT